MTTENINQLEKLFVKLLERCPSKSVDSDSQHIIQLQGQLEESLDLLNDVIEELRTIDPESVSTLKSLTLQIFEEEVH